jgi:predicted nuclease of restriction endonuclease-like RecB superfamily
MLTADLVKPRLQARGDFLHIHMLEPSTQHWQKTAQDLISLFQQHHGKTQSAWAASLMKYEGDRTDYEVIRGLAKVIAEEA